MSTAYLVGVFGSGLAPGTVPAPAPMNGHLILRYTHLMQVIGTPGELIPVTPVRLPIIDGVLCHADGVRSTTTPIPVQATNDPALAQTGVRAQLDFVFDGGSDPVQAILELPEGSTVDVTTAARAGEPGAVFVSGLTPNQLDELAEGLAATEQAAAGALVTLDQTLAAAAAAEAAAEGAAAPSDATIATLLATPGSATRAAMDAIESQPGYDVVLLIGQSNMVGAGATADPAVFDASVGRVYAFGAGGPFAQQIILGSDPLPHYFPKAVGQIGPGMEFARSYVATRPVHRKVLLVPAAVSSTGFLTSPKRWKTDHVPVYDNLYEGAIRQAQLALAAAGPNSRIVGFLWHQGEGDSGNAGSYATNLDALITGLRSRLGVPEAWFVLGQMVPASFTVTPTKASIDAIHIDTARRVPRTALAYGNDLHNPDDTTHYSAAGQRALGQGYSRAIALAQANVTGTPPLPPVSVASVQSAPGTLLVRVERPACRFTDFVFQYRLVGATAWITWAHTASPHRDALITGLVAGSSYEVRAATVNEAGTSAWSATATLTAAVPLWSVPSVAPWRAYALRKVNPAYAGACVRVRRSSDNTLADIGFTAAGLLDEDALKAHVGAGDGFVQAWFNQSSGSNLSVTNSATAQQPMIVAAGVVLKENGRPCIAFDGVDDNLWSATPGIATASGATGVMVVKEDGSTEAVPRILSEGASSGAVDQYSWGISRADGSMINQRRATDGVVVSASTVAAVAVPGRMQVLAFTDDTTAVRTHSDRRETDPVARVRSAAAYTVDRFTLGALVRAAVFFPAKVRISEAIFWQIPLTDADRRAVMGNALAHHNL